MDSDSLADLPPTTRWYRRNGRQSRKAKAVKQQYLSPQEEKSLTEYMLRMSHCGHPLPVKALRSLAQTIRRQRSSTFQLPAADDVPPPGKNWPQDFYKRHPELRARRTKAIDCNRHGQNIFDKIAEWFVVIGQELNDPAVLPENVYNMDETGVLISVLGSLKVLVDRDELWAARPASVQRTLITAIECISGDGRYLDPLIIWPAVTHRSTWTAHPTPGWHFACSKSGYTDTAISLYWVQHVFDAQTKARANGRPRLLISDGFATHESIEILTYCFQNNIIPCRLPSHTSHKLQPLDVGVFGPLKTAYREQVERLYRGGARTVGKQHFTLLYKNARELAFTDRNIRSSWSKAGLFPFNPERVLRDMQQPASVTTSAAVLNNDRNVGAGQMSQSSNQVLRTPTTSAGFHQVCLELENNLVAHDEASRIYLQKIAHAAEKAFSDRALLFDENKLLFEQNNEKLMRDSTKRAVVGRAKVMSYQDLIEAQRKRDEKEARKATKKHSSEVYKVPTARMLSIADEERMHSEREIEEMGLTHYCRVVDLST